MQSEIILQNIPRRISNQTILGNLKVEQSYPLQCSSRQINTAFNYSSVKDEKNLKDFKIENIIQNQKKRNSKSFYNLDYSKSICNGEIKQEFIHYFLFFQ